MRPGVRHEAKRERCKGKQAEGRVFQTGHPDKPYESSLRTDTCAKICKAAQKFPLEAKKKRLPWKGGIHIGIVHMGKLSIGRVSEEK